MQYQLNVFLDRCISTLSLSFHGSKCGGWHSKYVSHTLCCHFCTHELPSRNYVSDPPLKVGEEVVSLMLSASYSYFLFLFLRKKFRVCGKLQTNLFNFLLFFIMAQTACLYLEETTGSLSPVLLPNFLTVWKALAQRYAQIVQYLKMWIW